MRTSPPTPPSQHQIPIPTTPLTAPSSSGGGSNEVSSRGNTGYLPPPTPHQPIKTSQQPIKNYFSTNKRINPPSPSQSAIKDRIDLLSEQQTPDNNPLPSLHQIPCPSIVTFNPTSLSHYTSNQNKINKILTKFSNKYDVIFLQETKLLAREGQALKTILSGHEVLYSNNPSNTGKNANTHTAGICTALSKKIFNKYTVKILTLPSALHGHCLALYISLPGTDFSLMLINLRLPTPSKKKVRAQEEFINLLHKAITPFPSKFTILGGDMNFVERASDTSGVFKNKKRPNWDLFKERFLLSDCASDLHTFFHKPGVPSNSHVLKAWSARLDRFYISHTEADLAVVKPVVVSDVHSIYSSKDRGLNSHVPTSLHFISNNAKKKTLRRISEDTINNENFVPYTSKFWHEALARNPHANPLTRLELFSSAIRKASKQIFNDRRSKIDLVVMFQKAVALYNHLSSNDPDDDTVWRISKNTPLLDLLTRDQTGWCTTRLKAFIDTIFKSSGVPEGAEELDHGEVGTPPPGYSPT